MVYTSAATKIACVNGPLEHLKLFLSWLAAHSMSSTNLFLALRVCRVTWFDDDKRGEGAWERGCVSVSSWKSAIFD